MNARAKALLVLERVENTDGYLNVVLDSHLQERPPEDPRDAGLITELCYGATRRQMALDYAISSCASRKVEQMEPKLLCALRLGAYQIFYLRVARRAAVAETVEALKQVGMDRAAGFANAVLRKLSVLESIPLPDPSDQLSHLAIRESHPAWLVSRWLRQFGRDRTLTILEANNRSAPVVVRVNSARITREELIARWREMGVEVNKTLVSPVGLSLPPLGRLADLHGYPEGLFQVQDEAAQLVGIYADLSPRARVLDACAAPGGKACHTAETRQVVAADLHGPKLRKIQAESQRLGLGERLRCEIHDATIPFPESWGSFDAVMVDAPCSGLGTLRRHPELRYRRQEVDLPRLASLQRKILENCSETVPAGGLLIYAVCTPEPEEGADQMEMFLRSHPEFTAEPPTLPVSIKLPLWQSYLRTLPGPEGMDGFFAARLRKMY